MSYSSIGNFIPIQMKWEDPGGRINVRNALGNMLSTTGFNDIATSGLITLYTGINIFTMDQLLLFLALDRLVDF